MILENIVTSVKSISSILGFFQSLLYPLCMKLGDSLDKFGIQFRVILKLIILRQLLHNWAALWQKQQNCMCAQRRLSSAWASTQSDQSLRCPLEEILDPYLSIKRTTKTLIRLGGCPGWSESSLGAHGILFVLSWGGSYVYVLLLGK